MLRQRSNSLWTNHQPQETEVMRQKAPNDTYQPPSINIKGHQLNTVDTLTYLGSIISNDATATEDVESRLAKASSSFGRLQKRVLKNHSLRIETKIEVYRAVVIATLLYGSEAWVLYRKHVNLLERFHQRCLRCIMGIQWQDYITNEEHQEHTEYADSETVEMGRPHLPYGCLQVAKGHLLW